MSPFAISNDQLDRFRVDGYFIAHQLFDAEEIDLLGRIARADHQISRQAASRRDGQGGAIRLLVENELNDDIYAAFVRCRRIVDTMERLLEGEVYHYHHKMILKEPVTGGAWEWHQDYGYWYNNGCLQVLKGSHHLGRIDHVKIGDQTGADPERVAVAKERLELVNCELEPGSAIFFHSNLLHSSAANASANPRWAFICCYNAARNDPYKESRHPRYSRLEKWPDTKIKEIGRSVVSSEL